MSSILLRRAQQIANRVSAESAIEVDRQDDDYGFGRRRNKKVKVLDTSATINIDGDPKRRATILHDALLTRANEMMKLIEIGIRFRQAIAAKQAQVGVTPLVTMRVGLLNRQKILEQLVNATESGILDIDELDARVKAMRNRLTNVTTTHGTASADITTVLLTETDRKAFESELTSVKRALLDVDDELGQLNATHTVDISDEDEQFLRDRGIA